MYLQNELIILQKRLYLEKICSHPLDESQLYAIYRYMGMIDPGSELMARLSDIEINYEQIIHEASDLILSLKDTITSCESVIKTLIDSSDIKKVTDNLSFSVSISDISAIHRSYCQTVEKIIYDTKIISNINEILAEIYAQAKACSASFLEIFHETKLAAYAAALNKDKDGIMSCKAMALQSLDSSKESSRTAVLCLKNTNLATNAINAVNVLLSESDTYFNISPNYQQFNAYAFTNNLIKILDSLKSINTLINIPE